MFTPKVLKVNWGNFKTRIRTEVYKNDVHPVTSELSKPITYDDLVFFPELKHNDISFNINDVVLFHKNCETPKWYHPLLDQTVLEKKQHYCHYIDIKGNLVSFLTDKVFYQISSLYEDVSDEEN
jgi:hypothetical protein